MARKKAEEIVDDVIDTPEGLEPTAEVVTKQEEKMVPLSDVKRLVAEALLQAEENKAQAIKPMHTTHPNNGL